MNQSFVAALDLAADLVEKNRRTSAQEYEAEGKDYVRHRWIRG
jgi:hypothetical protein